MTIKTFLSRLSRPQYYWPLAFILLLTGTYFIKPLRSMVNRITATEDNIRYIPHQAPDSSLLGRYEQVSGPFRMPVNNQDIIIEDHQWGIDLENKEYRASGNGYIKVKNAEGKEEYAAMEFSEAYAYDTMRTRLPATHPLVTLPPKNTTIPDTLPLVQEVPQEGIMNRGLWETFRTIRLPITIIMDDQEIVVNKCTVTHHHQKSPPTRETTITGTLRNLSKPNDKAEPLTMALEELVKQ